ncbi:MAG: M20/M25/M40 family metallo-hydrolase [Polyangiaceae bacterium]|nr:M20/M25/M40 family metallo-hydrolase [Polyangiaceae bacterium]
MPARLDRTTLRRQVAGSRAAYERDLRQLVEIPTVSVDPSHAADMARGARAAAEVLERHGATAAVLPTDGFPFIVGELATGASNPTVTVYNHMDVQPADGDDWTRAPFELHVEKDRFFGRGATDDKGPALAALLGARLAVEAGVPINVRFLWEMEEEIGSPSFARGLRRYASRLATDSVVVSDTIWVARGKPALSTGLRGLAGATLRLETGTRDVHSGLCGGAARNPIADLVAVLAATYDARTGRVKIPGFYSDVVPPTRAELDSFERSGFTAAAFRRAHGLRVLRHDSARDLMRAIWAAPTFEVHGIAGGYQGPGVKTVIPPWAEAKVSFRLVPGQQPKRVIAALRAHVKKLDPRVVVRAESELEPFLGETSGPLAAAARDAVEFGFGRQPALVREGGSIGAVLSMQRAFGCPVTLLGLSLPEHGYHGPNEFFDWGQASGGALAFARYLEQLAALGRPQRARRGGAPAGGAVRSGGRGAAPRRGARRRGL